MVVEVSAHGAEREKTKGPPFFGCPVLSTTLNHLKSYRSSKNRQILFPLKFGDT